ncbi:MAG: hypothetical protein ATN35_11615 [Epulopiscium sp. Nele67-Bin004]|nr:MAG: hypothetical protein ATN35_11615 [Epulopiscium sp. Nele67-Bin004]
MSLIKQKLESNKILIAAHRGSYGGNIIQNSVAAYKAAIKQNADMIEIDVVSSKDGVLYGFHTNVESYIGLEKEVHTMTSEEIDNYNCTNVIGEKSGYSIPRFEAVLEEFREKCLINVDRAFIDQELWEKTITVISNAKAHNYVLLKSPVKEKLLKYVAETDENIMFMPIMYKFDEINTVKQYNINVVAAELIFDSEDHELVSDTAMDYFKSNEILTWVNSIDLGERFNLSGGFTDTKAITESEDDNWGKLIELGFDIIQTDWPAILHNYLISRGIK